jgi:8-oxo-dGTP pyrophosphatase MutT (NUDIX family)
MKIEHSFGIIPVYTDTSGVFYFLLVQHTAGHWAFPKGHAEPGETEIIAAARELFEETRISDCEIFEKTRFEETYTISKSVLSNNKQAGEEVHKTVVYFIAMVKQQDVNITDAQGEIQDYAWLQYEKALNKITFSESKNILTEAINYLTVL